MSSHPEILSSDRSWCILANTAFFNVITVRPLSPAERIPTNNYSWMVKANQRWLTLAEFEKLFGERAPSALASYSNIYTLERLHELNDK
jgi:hypothetical protein